MAEPTAVVAPTNNRPLPAEVEVAPDLLNAVTPLELRHLKLAYGGRLDELMGEAGDVDVKMQAAAFIALRRQGHHPSWDDCENLIVRFALPAPDPTRPASSTSSSRSAASGA